MKGTEERMPKKEDARAGQEANAEMFPKGESRREKVEELARTLREQSSAVFEAQMVLLEGPTNEKQLNAAKRLLGQYDYEDVITERAIAGVCGYPLCDNLLPETSTKKGRYRISLAHKRVYDTSETVRFCCLDHVIESKGFKASLEDERPLLPTGGELQALVDAVKGLAKKESVLAGRSKADDVTLPLEGSSASPRVMRPTLVERAFTPAEDAAFQPPLLGHAGAIEGYIPKTAPRKPDLKEKEAASSSKKSPSRKSCNAKKESIVALTEDSSTREWRTGDQGEPQNKRSEDGENRIGKERHLRVEEEASISEGADVEWSRRLDESAAEAGIPVTRYTEGGTESNKTESEASLQDRASGGSRGPSFSEKLSRGPEQEKKKRERQIRSTESIEEAERDVEKATPSTVSQSEQRQKGSETDLRLQSAQAVADALAEAAAKVQAGELEESEAMQSLGMTVQPANEGPPRGSRATMTEVSEPEASTSGRVRRGIALGKVTDKPPSEIQERSNAEPSSRLSVTSEEDCGQGWMDSPPEGFSTELSTFGTLWIALDTWISSETLSFLGGTDFQAGHAGAGEYRPRIVLENGVSAGISKAFQENIARALPDVQKVLQLKVPRPNLEEALGKLARTFSFTAPLPSLKQSGWRFVTLLLLRALSLQHVPSLQSYFEDGTRLEKALRLYSSAQSEYVVLLEKLVLESVP